MILKTTFRLGFRYQYSWCGLCIPSYACSFQTFLQDDFVSAFNGHAADEITHFSYAA